MGEDKEAGARENGGGGRGTGAGSSKRVGSGQIGGN